MMCFKWQISGFLVASLLTASLLAQEAAQDTTSSPEIDKEKLDQKFDSKVNNVVDTICKNLDEPQERELHERGLWKSIKKGAKAAAVAKILFGRRDNTDGEAGEEEVDTSIVKRSWLRKTWARVRPWVTAARVAYALGKRMSEDEDVLDQSLLMVTRQAEDNTTEKVCSSEESERLNAVKKATEDLNKLVALSEAAGC
ncbi:uncharacterized protein LOC106060368 [Biomphalaria glabrata]|uniref:Uncharacterized protein LOC106060368 n=1 Tax=Biomphalaria glabrata TaxID=6526 RepID=A0A9W3ABA0_BIOGL|nr:uncharacterized protein LOC106060368 [Biomphalaria glabrata]